LYQVFADHWLRGFAKFAIESCSEETRIFTSDLSPGEGQKTHDFHAAS